MNNPNSRRARIEKGSGSRPNWLAAILWRTPRLLARLLQLWACHRMAGRRIARSLSGAALLLALGVAPARAGAITVVDGEVAISQNGLCSLIEAVHNANDTTDGAPHADCAPGDPAADGMDYITLPPSGDFVLAAVDNTAYGASGLPVITSHIFITAYGATIRRDEAAEPFRVLAVGREGDLSINGGAISGGHVAAGSARAADVTYAGSGGGILNMGALNLRETTLSGNTAAVGGGLYNAGRLTGQAHFIDNSAAYGGDALLSFGEARLDDIDVRHNGGQPFSGAIENEGTMEILGGYIRDNESPTSLINRGDLTIYYLTIENGGAGISNSGAATVQQTTITGHRTGISNAATAFVNQSTLTGNGRGILNSGGLLTLVNSTISGNHNPGDGGGILVTGGGIEGAFNTITDNSADRGGGAFVVGSYDEFYNCSAGSLSLRNSILSGNRAVNGPEGYVEQDSFRCLGWLGLHGSLAGHDGDAGLVNAFLNETLIPDEPMAAILHPTLEYNGWPAVKTHALPWGSPAVDALANETCEASPVDGVDQRQMERNQDGDFRPSDRECDIGAFERQLPAYRTFAPLVGGAVPGGGDDE